MKQHITYYLDGPFSNAPRLFYQIVTLHVLGVVLLCVFDLLHNKEINNYIRVLRLVEEMSASLEFTISPQCITKSSDGNMVPFPLFVRRQV